MSARFLTGVVAAALAALMSTAQAQTVTLKLGHVDPPTSHSGAGAEAFAKEVERLSNGTMKVDVFHAGKLGTIPEQIKNVFLGAQDIHLLYPEFLANMTEESKILSAPYVFRNIEHMQAFQKSELYQPTIERVKAEGAVLLDAGWTWFQNDPRGVISIRPIFTPADLKGLKMRLYESKTAIETWRGLGANTVVVARPEMYLAFKQGIIEAGPETIGLAYDAKNVEVAKFWTRTDEYYQIINLMMNAKRYNALTDAQRKILQDATVVGGKVFAAESARGFTEKREKARNEYGVSIIEPNPAPWRELGKSVVTNLEEQGVIPKGLAAKVAALKN